MLYCKVGQASSVVPSKYIAEPSLIEADKPSCVKVQSACRFVDWGIPLSVD